MPPMPSHPLSSRHALNSYLRENEPDGSFMICFGGGSVGVRATRFVAARSSSIAVAAPGGGNGLKGDTANTTGRRARTVKSVCCCTRLEMCTV